jgi:hypothetical protein
MPSITRTDPRVDIVSGAPAHPATRIEEMA